jgi:hypothetical protein
MFVLHSFCGHNTERIEAEVNGYSDLVVIPGGMTKLLPLLDVVINWPFKVAFQGLYNQGMTTAKLVLTLSNRVKHTPLPAVCE